MIKPGGQGISSLPLDLFIKKNLELLLPVSISQYPSFEDTVFIFFWKLNDFWFFWLWITLLHLLYFCKLLTLSCIYVLLYCGNYSKFALMLLVICSIYIPVQYNRF
jgi:hypothetical protein